ncbi:antibiotic biosynthesis monooxygenase [Planctomycetota bacterium]|nr:antibiotic biosynthesis monooxygenase [Planctomycetota bacterium]
MPDRELLVVTAKIVLVDEYQAALDSDIRELVAVSKLDPGCLQYDLHQSIEDKNVYFLYETWVSEESLADHMDAAHVKAWQRLSEGKIAGFELLKMIKLM